MTKILFQTTEIATKQTFWNIFVWFLVSDQIKRSVTTFVMDVFVPDLNKRPPLIEVEDNIGKTKL